MVQLFVLLFFIWPSLIHTAALPIKPKDQTLTQQRDSVVKNAFYYADYFLEQSNTSTITAPDQELHHELSKYPDLKAEEPALQELLHHYMQYAPSIKKYRELYEHLVIQIKKNIDTWFAEFGVMQPSTEVLEKKLHAMLNYFDRLFKGLNEQIETLYTSDTLSAIKSLTPHLKLTAQAAHDEITRYMQRQPSHSMLSKLPPTLGTLTSPFLTQSETGDAAAWLKQLFGLSLITQIPITQGIKSAIISADASTIAVSDVDESLLLFTQTHDGTYIQSPTLNSGHDTSSWHPALSYDGSTLAIASRLHTVLRVFAKTAQGIYPTIPIFQSHPGVAFYESAINSDGSCIATVNHEGLLRVFIRNDDGTYQSIVPHPLLEMSPNPAISADGSTIVTTSSGGSTLHTLVRAPHNTFPIDNSFSVPTPSAHNRLWSPCISADGSTIAVSSANGIARVFMRTYNDEHYTTTLTFQSDANTSYHKPLLSVNGTTMTTINKDNVVRVFSRSPSGHYALTFHHTALVPAMSSNGSTIAAINKNHALAVFVRDTDGFYDTSPTLISNKHTYIAQPSISANGSIIIAHTHNMLYIFSMEPIDSTLYKNLSPAQLELLHSLYKDWKRVGSQTKAQLGKKEYEAYMTLPLPIREMLRRVKPAIIITSLETMPENPHVAQQRTQLITLIHNYEATITNKFMVPSSITQLFARINALIQYPSLTLQELVNGIKKLLKNKQYASIEPEDFGVLFNQKAKEQWLGFKKALQALLYEQETEKLSATLIEQGKL